MRRFRLWTSAIGSRIDWMVRQVENHEAMADSAIRDMQRSAAQAKVRLQRVRQDGERMRRRVAELGEAELAWRSRAAGLAVGDEARAIECLRRAKRSARVAEQLRSELEEHARAERQLTTDIAKVEQRLAQLQQQRNLLRTRESRAEALAAAAGTETCSEVDDIVERWETKIVEAELRQGCLPSASEDSFEEEFVRYEDEEELRAELAELTSGAGTPPAEDDK